MHHPPPPPPPMTLGTPSPGETGGDQQGSSTLGPIRNSIGNSIGNSIKKNPGFPETPFYKYFDYFKIVLKKGLMPY